MSNNININLNKFLNDVAKKKQYIYKLKKNSSLLNNIKQKNYKYINSILQNHYQSQLNHDNVIMYIIDITFSRSNTFLHVMDSSGKLKFFCSAGHLQYKGKDKKFRFTVFKGIYQLLVTKLSFLKNKPIALHLKNVGFNRFWLIKKLKEKFYIKTIKSFNSFPYNGCRKRKVRRKKFKKKNEEMAERFKAADCKSVEFSHRRFKSFFLQKATVFLFSKSKYNAAVACLLWEQEVMCSNHIISINIDRFVIF